MDFEPILSAIFEPPGSSPLTVPIQGLSSPKGGCNAELTRHKAADKAKPKANAVAAVAC